MCNQCKRVELHVHSDMSNIRLIDSINTIEEIILKASEMGMDAVALTDHESISNHIKALKAVKKFKKEEKIPQNFKMILGNEIYLVENLESVRDNYVGGGVTKFPHFLILAKNKKGHEAMRALSSKAWENSFYTGMMERVPTTMDFMKETLEKYKNTLIGSSACLGSSVAIHTLGREEAKKNKDKELEKFHEDKLHSFIRWCIDVFGKDDFYLELQPSGDYEQRTVNLELIKLSEQYGLEMIITNDVHYLRPEDREIHSAYLRSKESERETDSFYAHTYLHENSEIFEKLNYISEDIIHRAFENTLKIRDKCEEYELEAPTEIPISKLPDFETTHLFENGYDKYQYIKNMAYSESEQDRYFLHLIEEGFMEKLYRPDISKEEFNMYVARIDKELEQLWIMSEKLNEGITEESKKQHMSSYYVTTATIVRLIWGDDCGDNSRKEGSLLGAGRGSASSWLVNYLSNITQINPLAYGMEIPYWRHLNHEMGDISSLDIDLDITSTKKRYIFERMREFFGEDKVVQVCTFGKEKPKSAINTACRGLGIDSDTAQYLGSFIPYERGEHWSLADCVYGNKEEGREPVKEFIREINQYPRLLETALRIEGLINKRSTHAGGVLILNDSYIKSNAIMRSPNGDIITQYNLDDSQATGAIKYDVLTIEANDKLQTAMELMLDYNVIEWQGTLRKTFEKYFHPEVIDKSSKELFELLGSGRVPDLFQLSTSLGQSVVKKVKPSNLIETAGINSIMRLMSDGTEQPIDTFVRFKNDISLWYKEMKDYGLNNEEIKVFEKHLLALNGVAASQENAMLLAMDEKIAGFDLYQATKLRKSISKKNKDASIEIKETFFKQGVEIGNRQEVLNYAWHQIERMLGYSFSDPHVLAYTLIMMIELNMFHYYNPIYWQTACLTVNSGSQELEEDDKKKDKNYGKVAEAIGKMKSYGVNIALPDINKAGFSFTPDADNNRIIYSLKGIVGLNDEAVHHIINNRPYSSFEDFYSKMYEESVIGYDEDGGKIMGKLLQKKHMLSLIKAGVFNSFDEPIEIMKQFIMKEIDVKTKLNMQNIKSVIRLGLLDTPELEVYKQIISFRDYINKLRAIRTIEKPKDTIVELGAYEYEFYQQNFPEQKALVGWNGVAEISTREFKKEYDEKMQYIKDLMQDEEFVRQFNIAQFLEMWESLADGTVPKWEMDSVSFYSGDHELDSVNTELYNIDNYSELDSTPEIIGYNKYMGRDIPKYKTHTIIGTVLDKNKDKHNFTILTPNGVVTCKMHSGSFAHYNKAISHFVNRKKETVEKSWFTRGNLVMVKGFRRDDQFVLRTYATRGQKKEHTVTLIKDVLDDGSLVLQMERERV